MLHKDSRCLHHRDRDLRQGLVGDEAKDEELAGEDVIHKDLSAIIVASVVTSGATVQFAKPINDYGPMSRT